MLLLFLYNRLIFFIAAVIAQIFISTAEHVISVGIATNDANAEIETQAVIVEARISKFSS